MLQWPIRATVGAINLNDDDIATLIQPWVSFHHRHQAWSFPLQWALSTLNKQQCYSINIASWYITNARYYQWCLFCVLTTWPESLQYSKISASRLKTAGELKIALAETSRRSMRERCTSIVDSNTDKPGLGLPTSNQVIIKSYVIESHKVELICQMSYVTQH